ncbi:SRPBCC family protein [Kribbella karoonensis]|uniref:Coenzyme Q-binding protein COQ10 START domain-containing protein n=1 Tax=Kribbella karoonensis TaxID=324851 RepID=A0ABP4NS45_9ACTN
MAEQNTRSGRGGADRSGSSRNGGGGLEVASLLEELPVDRLKGELQDALSAVVERTIEAATGKVGDLTERLTDVADGGSLRESFGGGSEGESGGGLKGSMVAGAVKGGLENVKDKLTGGSSGNGAGKATKATNIIEQIDVGVPLDVAYDQWTQFQDFPDFMKKVESVEQESDEKLTWRAKIVWSHRTWEATILDQVPDERIVWRSNGQKGHVDGAVTFHELAPNLTRILVVLEYYPQGLFERVGNIWRAQGRRARAELKHFRRHVMTRTILAPDELEGWRGEIHDSQVVRGHDEPEPDNEDDADDQYDEDEDDADDQYDDEGDEGDADEYDEGDGDEDEDEYGDDEYDEEDEEDGEDGDEDEPDEGWDEDEDGDAGDLDEEYDEYDDEDEDEGDERERRGRRAS